LFKGSIGIRPWENAVALTAEPADDDDNDEPVDDDDNDEPVTP